MSPPTEQLIRDYLNRLSVAARGRLNSDDRRALVTRTHDFIERNASRSGPPIPMEVAALLSRLGDPGALVDQEVARLAAERGESVGPEADQATGLAARLRRRTANASWRWPTAAAHPDLVTELLNGTGGNGAKPPPAQPTDPAAVVPRQPGPADPGAVQGGLAAQSGGAAQTAPHRPVWPAAATRADGGSAVPERGEAAAGGSAAPERDEAAAGAAAGGPAKNPETPLAESFTHRPAGPGEGSGPAEPSVPRRSQPSATRPTRPSADRPARDGLFRSAPAQARIRSLASRGMALSRRHPLEATAIVLLGLGGVIFPPVWLLGVCVAVPSRAWDYRDKWAGLGGPVVLLVIGTTVGLTLGRSEHQLGAYLHEAWVYLNILSRLCAVAGTWYLCWRLTHARKVPDVPPWNRARRVD